MANLLASPRSFKNKALLLKTETTVGTDAVPTGAANWIEGRNVTITPMDAETADRGIDQPYFGSGGKLQVAQYCKISFEVALVGSGAAGTAPKLAPALLACAMAETIVASASAAYNLVSSAIGACSIYFNMDGVLHKLIGSRGTASVSMASKSIPKIKFDFEAVFADPSTVALPSVTKTGWLVEEPVSAANTTALTINAVSLAMQSLDASLGNKLARINLPGPQTDLAITDRAVTANVTVLAPALAAFDPFALAKAGTNVPISITHGSVAGKKAKLDLKGSLTGVEYDQIEGLLAYKLSIDCAPVAGNDEFALTFL